jgi:quercetin dioxygenase-like cupin family protein
VQVLDGSAHLTIGGKNVTVPAGQIIIMPANVPHSVVAKEKFKMLMTMIRT